MTTEDVRPEVVQWFHESEEICPHDELPSPCEIMADHLLRDFAVEPRLIEHRDGTVSFAPGHFQRMAIARDAARERVAAMTAEGRDEALRALAREWRRQSSMFSQAVSARVRRQCAKELEAALAQPSEPGLDVYYIRGVVSTALYERDVPSDDARWVLQELDAALARLASEPTDHEV